MLGLMVNLDPRMKLLIAIVYISSAYFVQSTASLLYLFLLISILYLLQKSYKTAMRVVVVFAVFELLKYLLGYVSNDDIAVPISYMIFFLQRTSVAFFMIGFISSKLNVSKLISSLHKMKIPMSIVVALAVIFRFAPTVKSEFISIKNTMKLRGVGINVKNIFLHPIRTAEYAFIPLFIRSIKIADEISVSAMTRGLGLQKQRSCYEVVKLRLSDVVITLIIILALTPAFFAFNEVYGGVL